MLQSPVLIFEFDEFLLVSFQNINLILEMSDDKFLLI